MALTYATYVTTIANLLAVPEADANYVQILPSMIDYAEQRIYRELDLLSTTVRDATSSLTPDSRNFTLPSGNGRFVVLDAINILSSGVRVAQLQPVSLEFLDAAWPSETSTGGTAVPEYFAMVTDQTIAVGPAPGAALGVEVIGEIRPTPLSVSNTTTYLTNYLPDLFIAASMIFGSGWQKNFGGQADDPKMSASWESQYQLLKASADLEEHRKQWASVSWTSKQPSPVAIPQRG
jgi:hypothetical protein